MTAFNVEVLLLLLLAFVLGLGLGLWLRRLQRRAAEAGVMVPVPAHLPPPVSIDPLPAAAVPPAAAAEVVAPEASPPSSVASDAGPSPATSEGRASGPPVRAPVADLFSHLLNVPPRAVVDEPPLDSRRRGGGTAVREGEGHPGVRPPVLAAPDGGVGDDLKRLKGIGPQNEQRLHALGIYHFHQIAAWTPEEAVWVGRYLAFPGRIEREDWIGQARTLVLAVGLSAEASASRKPKGED
ncbi:hypothetical protein [Xanthobacter agilis]|uniref:hypothetical protein n=1 Tax=Xanthobacter agilis TaxID=47492 RepID=UPI00372D6CD5